MELCTDIKLTHLDFANKTEFYELLKGDQND